MPRKRPYPENILHDLKVEGMTEAQLDFSCLTARENAVMQLYYRDNQLTRKEIAAEFAVPERRLVQIIQCAPVKSYAQIGLQTPAE